MNDIEAYTGRNLSEEDVWDAITAVHGTWAIIEWDGTVTGETTLEVDGCHLAFVDVDRDANGEITLSRIREEFDDENGLRIYRENDDGDQIELDENCFADALVVRL